MDYKIKSAVGRFIIVEEAEKSTVLKVTETATVFKIISFGIESNRILVGQGWMPRDEFKIGDLIIVPPSTVDKTVMGGNEVYYIRDTDIIAVVEE